MFNVCFVVIFGGVCILFCCQNMVYLDVGNFGMLVCMFGVLVECFGLYGQQFGEVVMGVVIKYFSDWNLGCEVMLFLGLLLLMLGIIMQCVCGILLDIIIVVVNKIVLGQIELGIGGGLDIIFDVLIVYGKKLCVCLLVVNCVKIIGDKFKVFICGFKFSEFKFEFFGVVELCIGKSMGDYCEDMVKEWNIFCDLQDEWVVFLYKKLVVVYECGFFNDLIVLFCGVECDNILCVDILLEKLVMFKLVFDKVFGCGMLIVVNFILFIDGVLVVLLVSEEWVCVYGYELLVYLCDLQVVVVDFVYGEGLLMVFIIVVLEMFKCNGLILQDFDIYEIYEVFVVQVLCMLCVWESEDYCCNCLGLDVLLGRIDLVRINLLGLLLVIGYLFVVIGVCVIVMVVKQLVECGGGCVLVLICIVGGMGVVVIVEC